MRATVRGGNEVARWNGCNRPCFFRAFGREAVADPSARSMAPTTDKV